MELEADDFGDEHRERLAEHRRLGLDPADSPAEDAEAIDHRRVGIGADERVRVGGLLSFVGAGEHRAAKVLEVHLVADAGAGRDDGEIAEGALPPAQEGVAFFIALELLRGVQQECRRCAVFIDLNRVIDDEVGGLQRVDAPWVAAEGGDRVAHRREVDHGRNAGEVLQEDAGDAEGDLALGAGLHIPARERFDVGAFDEGAVLVPEEILEEDLERHRQGRDGRAGERRERVESVDHVRLATDGEDGAGVERVERSHGRSRKGLQESN